MNIAVKLAFDEQGALSLLNWLAGWNAQIIHADPAFPSLYESGVVYRTETREIWCDALNLLALGYEDCDALAAWRVGELLARGWKALGPGDPGVAAGMRLRPTRIEAQVSLITYSKKDSLVPGLYHCQATYWIGGREYIDDPSARLGMREGQIDPFVLERWEARRQGAVTTAPPARGGRAA